MSDRKKYETRINDIEKKNIFSVPEGYFEDFSSRLQLKLHDEKESQHVHPGILGISRYKLAMAASFIGLIIITYSGIKFFSGKMNNSKNQAIEIADIINYHVNELDENMIFNFYEENSLEDSVQNDISDEKILDGMIDYIASSDIDLQLIAQEL
jgi:hypothetical protein